MSAYETDVIVTVSDACINSWVVDPCIYGVMGHFIINAQRGDKGDPGGISDASVLGNGHFWENGILNNDNFVRESSLGLGFAYGIDGKIYVDVSTIAGGVTFAYVDVSLNAKTDKTYTSKQDISIGLKTDKTYTSKQDISIGLKADKTYIDASLLSRDIAINLRATNASVNSAFITNTSLGLVKVYDLTPYATNVSVGNAFITNTSLGLVGIYDLTPYATNVSVGNAFITNTSLGLVGIYDLTPYATNVSVGLAIENFATNVSVGNAFITNISLGLVEIYDLTPYATNVSVNSAFITNTSLGLVEVYDLTPYATNVSVGNAFITNTSLGLSFDKVNYINDSSLNQSKFKYVAGYLEPSIASSGGTLISLTDVSIVSPISNQVLAYDTVWKNMAAVDVSIWNVVNASDYFWIFSDVSLTSPLNNQVLAYHGASSTFVNKTIDNSLYEYTEASIYFQKSITFASPASNGTGNMGDLSFDASYFYVCTSTNKWMRILGITAY